MTEPTATFRPLTRADLGLIRGWLAECSGSGLSVPPGDSWGPAQLSASNLEAFLLCDHRATPVGFLRMEFVGDAAEVTVLVAPDQRQRGIGLRLLGHAQCRALARGTRLLLAHLQHDNVAAHRLFTRAGYVSVASRLLGVSCFERRLRAGEDAVPLVIDP